MKPLKITSWNIARRETAWRTIVESDSDIALLQEANEPPPDIAETLNINPGSWQTSGGSDRRWRTAILQLSDRLDIEWLKPKSLIDAKPGEFAVSQPGTLAVALVTPSAGKPFTVVSMYALWEHLIGKPDKGWIYADASAHRLISDLSGLVNRQQGQRIVAAGDLNALYGYGEKGNKYWADRYATIFDRMSALGLPFVGPQSPEGRLAEPWPDELPPTSKNVPTYHARHQTPTTATRQLDFVFASRDLTPNISVKALNSPDYWGPSDHCRIETTIACD